MYNYKTKYRIEDNGALACFICPSLNEIMRIFGENIITLKARGGKQLEKDKSELKTLGLTLSRMKDNSCVVNYDKSYSQVWKHDDLDKKNIKIILKYLEKYDIRDCAVEYLKIKIVDKELKEMIQELFPERKIDTNVFFAEFELKMCESEIDREKWEEEDYNMKHLAPLKFKRSLLHCFKLVDENQLLVVQKKLREYYIDWKPTRRKDYFPFSPKEVALLLMKNLEPYGYIKFYKYSSNKKLKLVGMK